MATVQMPDSVQRQLFALDRQVRDAMFGRGISRLALIVPILVGASLAVDWTLGLSGGVRLLLLLGCGSVAAFVAWRMILIPIWRPASLAELAALVERQHPELKERLSSLVELQDHDAPGASPLMRDLLARQTAKAVDQLDLSDAAPAIRSPGTALLAVTACMLLFAPFAWRPVEYGLLWARLFAPLGNFHWGATELIVVDGDRVVAKGSDVPVQIDLRQHSSRKPADSGDQESVVWLHWTDTAGVRDSRRLEWDVDTRLYSTTLPRVAKGLLIYAATADARSEQHRIDVAEPPVITRLQLDIEPPAYTGLPARALDGAQGEIRAAERSRIVMKLEFGEPVASAELAWPIPAETVTVGEKPITERTVPAKLASDRRSAVVEALATSSGPFAIHLKNANGLTNTDPPRSLLVDPDLPPAISLEGNEVPVAVRADDRHIISGQVQDDFGLTVVELHLESSTGQKRIDAVPAELLRTRTLTHEFPVDVSDFELKPGQAITYRVRAVDNRPIPGPQESWTKSRTLMIDTKSQAPADPELARQERSIKEEIGALREDLAKTKTEMEKLHRRTEDESLKQKNSDKSEQLTKLQQQQAELTERLQKLAAELASQQLTRKLGERATQMADRDLAEAQRRLERAKLGEPRDQLQPISEAIDRLASVDKQLQSLDQQLSELKRLEQDLAQLEQLARNTDRLAEQLEKLDRQTRDSQDTPPASKQTDPAAGSKPDDAAVANTRANPDQAAKPDNQPAGRPTDQQPADQKPADAGHGGPPNSEAVATKEQREKLLAESRKLADEFEQLLKKHPELLDAARRDQLQRLEQLAEQASALAKPQEQLAKAFDQAAAEAASTRPAGETPKSAPESGDGESKPAPNPAAAPPKSESDPNANPKANPSQPANQTPAQAQAAAGAQAVQAQQQLAQEATRQALNLAQQEGPDSKATQSALQFARQAAAAARDAQTGNLDQAAQQSQEAAKAAQEAAQELAPPGQPSTPQSEQASQLAARQEQLTQELQQLSGNKAAQQGAQQQGQRQLAEATEALSKQLEQAAKNLGASPLNSQPGADAASKAQQAANVAQQAMKQAADAAKSNDARAAAQQSASAAEKLQQVAKEASGAPETPQGGQAIPEELATKVAQAAQQLQQAQKQLNAAANPEQPTSKPNGEKPTSSQDGQSPAGQEKGQAQPGQAQPGQAQPGQGQPGQGQPGQGQPGQGQPGQGQPGQGQPGQGQPGQGQPGQGQPGQGQPGQGQPGQGQPGQGQPGQAQPGQAQPGQAQPGQAQPGQAQPGQGQPGQGQPGQGQPGQGQPGQGQPGQGQPGQGQPGQGQPGQGQPGQGQPGQGQPGQGQPGQGQPGQGQPGQGQPTTELARSAEQFRQAAAAMRRAINPGGSPQAPGKPGQNQPGSQEGAQQAQAGMESEPGEPGEPGGAGGAGGGGGAQVDADLKQLDAELKKQGQRNWGRLPGQLRTEILQGATKKPRPEYAKQIKSYFEEIAKPAAKEATP